MNLYLITSILVLTINIIIIIIIYFNTNTKKLPKLPIDTPKSTETVIPDVVEEPPEEEPVSYETTFTGINTENPYSIKGSPYYTSLIDSDLEENIHWRKGDDPNTSWLIKQYNANSGDTVQDVHIEFKLYKIDYKIDNFIKATHRLHCSAYAFNNKTIDDYGIFFSLNSAIVISGNIIDDDGDVIPTNGIELSDIRNLYTIDNYDYDISGNIGLNYIKGKKEIDYGYENFSLTGKLTLFTLYVYIDPEFNLVNGIQYQLVNHIYLDNISVNDDTGITMIGNNRHQYNNKEILYDPDTGITSISTKEVFFTLDSKTPEPDLYPYIYKTKCNPYKKFTLTSNFKGTPAEVFPYMRECLWGITDIGIQYENPIKSGITIPTLNIESGISLPLDENSSGIIIDVKCVNYDKATGFLKINIFYDLNLDRLTDFKGVGNVNKGRLFNIYKYNLYFTINSNLIPINVKRGYPEAYPDDSLGKLPTIEFKTDYSYGYNPLTKDYSILISGHEYLSDLYTIIQTLYNLNSYKTSTNIGKLAELTLHDYKGIIGNSPNFQLFTYFQSSVIVTESVLSSIEVPTTGLSVISATKYDYNSYIADSFNGLLKNNIKTKKRYDNPGFIKITDIIRNPLGYIYKPICGYSNFYNFRTSSYSSGYLRRTVFANNDPLLTNELAEIRGLAVSLPGGYSFTSYIDNYATLVNTDDYEINRNDFYVSLMQVSCKVLDDNSGNTTYNIYNLYVYTGNNSYVNNASFKIYINKSYTSLNDVTPFMSINEIYTTYKQSDEYSPVLVTITHDTTVSYAIVLTVTIIKNENFKGEYKYDGVMYIGSIFLVDDYTDTPKYRQLAHRIEFTDDYIESIDNKGNSIITKLRPSNATSSAKLVQLSNRSIHYSCYNIDTDLPNIFSKYFLTRCESVHIVRGIMDNDVGDNMKEYLYEMSIASELMPEEVRVSTDPLFGRMLE